MHRRCSAPALFALVASFLCAIAAAGLATFRSASAQVGTAQVSTAQVSTAQVGTAQVGTAQVETAPVETAPVGTAQVETARPSSERAASSQTRDLNAAVEEFRAYAEAAIAEDNTPGLSIGFVYGDTEWADGFGFADLENDVPATAESSYRTASVTKPMTAMGVLALVESGLVDLDAEVQEYVPYFPRKEHPVTVRQLLGHLGGISHYRNYDEEGHFKDHKDTREAIAVFEDFDLVAEPGTKFQYTSYGYNLLGAVIEGASGKSYGDHLREVLWGPLGMDATLMDDPLAIIPHRVRGYQPGPGGKVIHSEFVDISSRFAAGGARSTVPDLLRLARGVLGRKVLSQETYEAMWTSMRGQDGRATGYGMGWGVGALNGRFRVQHSGAQAETRTFLVAFPQDQLAIAVACNYEGASYMPYVQRLFQLVTGEPWSTSVYAGGTGQQAMYAALEDVFNEGLGYYDRWESASTEDAARVGRAFELFNTHVDAERLASDRDSAQQAAEVAREQGLGDLFVILGSTMAERLAEAHGPSHLDRAHGRGALHFVNDYVTLCRVEGAVPSSHHLSENLADIVAEWSDDWDRTWNELTQSVTISPDTDVAALAARLSREFEGASIYPDFSDDLIALLTDRFLAGDAAGSAAAVTASMELYPQRDQGFVYAGVIQMASGDREQGLALIREGQRIDPGGASSAARLNVLAYQLKGYGQVDLGLLVLDAAVELHPEAANLYDSTGEFYLEIGDREKGISFYQKALEIDPELATARRVLEELGIATDL